MAVPAASADAADSAHRAPAGPRSRPRTAARRPQYALVAFALPVRAGRLHPARRLPHTPTRRCRTGSRSLASFGDNKARAALLRRSPTTCSQPAATPPGASAARSRSSPRSSGSSPPCARCAPRRTPGGWSSCSPASVGRGHALWRRSPRSPRSTALLWLGETLGLPRRGCRRRLGVPRAGDGVGDARLRRGRRDRQPARTDPRGWRWSSALGGRRGHCCCGSSPTLRAASAGCAG